MSNYIKTSSDLRAYVEAAGHAPYFFDRRTMRIFGDTMRNYGVRLVTVRTLYNEAGEYIEGGAMREAYELFRRRPVKHGLQSSAYFDACTFRQIHCVVSDE